MAIADAFIDLWNCQHFPEFLLGQKNIEEFYNRIFHCFLDVHL